MDDDVRKQAQAILRAIRGAWADLNGPGSARQRAGRAGLRFSAYTDDGPLSPHVRDVYNATGVRAMEDRIVVVPILRAGLGMVEGVLRLIPGARVGHLGFYRNEETLQPVRYYGKLPPDAERCSFLLVDPMLGTGGTACASIADLKARGAHDIALMCLIAAPEGAGRLAMEHPDVPIFAAALDRRLNKRGYILPGLGDGGDRLFGTL